MQIKLSSVTQSALEKAASSQRKTAEQLVEELLARRYQTGVTVTDYAMIFDRFDSESRADMVISLRMSDQAGIALTNAARQAKTTPEAVVLGLVEQKFGGKKDAASDPNLRTRVALDLLKTQESVARESYIERLKQRSGR